MMNKHHLTSVLSNEQLDALENTVGRLRSVGEFLADLYDGFKDSKGILDVLREVHPFVGAAGTAFSETIAPVKFVVKLLDKLVTIDDPETLAAIACTTAYQQSVCSSLVRFAHSLNRETRVQVRQRAAAAAERVDFLTMSFDSIAGHAFVEQSNRELAAFASSLGFSDTEIRRLTTDVTIGFATQLKLILTHPSSSERFRPWTSLVQIGNEEARAFGALAEHLAYQRQLFRDSPLLRVEPFALRDIYVPLECGSLTWKEMRDQPSRNPFKDSFGGRHDLLATTISLMKDSKFSEAIVIQGVAGAGKSSFSLALTDALAEQGFRPIRVRLRDLDPSRPLLDALGDAVTFGAENAGTSFGAAPRGQDIFLGGRIFDHPAVDFGERKLSPWVVILDGWDELQTGSIGFHRQLEDFLREVRSAFLDRRGCHVQVILTGRPSDAVHESRFLRDSTRILTVRALAHVSFQDLVGRVHLNLQLAPTGGKPTWSLSAERAQVLVQTYVEAASKVETEALEILGQPLLAVLAIRLFGQREDLDMLGLLGDTTTLLRRFVDLMCDPSRREDALEPNGRARLEERDLRLLLRETASAITIFGREMIPTAELQARLARLAPVDLSRVEKQHQHPITVMLIAFFFNVSNKNLGSEFVHKSFREYLFAECIVEHLIDFAAASPADLGVRVPFWQDFGASDPRSALVRKLSVRLGPQWLAPEVRRHIVRLLELARRDSRLSDAQWACLRDALADIWCWWAEGVHLRAQPDDAHRGWTSMYAHQLALDALELEADRRAPVNPIRSVVVDAHLGDALVQLTALVHALSPEVKRHHLSPSRPYQQIDLRAGVSFRPFRDQGQDYAKPLIARINAAGWRPEGSFPTGAVLPSVDLSHGNYSGLSFAQARLSGMRCEGGDFFRASFNGADLSGAIVSASTFSGCILADANLNASSFTRCVFMLAVLDDSMLLGASFAHCDVRCASFDNTSMDSTSAIARSDARGASFYNAMLDECSLEGSYFDDADFARTTGCVVPEGARADGALMYVRDSVTTLVEGPVGVTGHLLRRE